MAFKCVSHFIGRHEEREQIKELLLSTDIQVLQIYGLPFAGKTELIRQVCQEISSELQVQTIFRRITNGQWPNTEICQFLKDIKISKMLSVIILDCFENLSKIEEFNQFCLENLWNIPRLKIILVFQGLFPLKIEGFSDERIQVKPMNKEDARCLFYRRTKLMLDNHSEQQVDELIDYCGALPGQIVELTNKISHFPANTSLAELYEFVKENKSFCQSEDIFAKLDRYIKSLPPEQCHAFSEVVYFPGTFTVKHITEMANYKNDLDAKFWFLYPLLGYGLLKSTDENNKQFQVPALFQDYANQQLAHLRHEDTTKLKFSNIIGKTLIEAEHLWKMGLTYEALGIMTNNWTNVQKLLQQAIHSPSDGNSFQVYYKVVIDASNIISLCCPNEAKLFCRAILDNAQIFGSEDQRALSMASYGHTLVESSEKEALQLYKTAEGTLRKHNHQYQVIILLYHMSKAYYQCGKLKKGIRCAEEAIRIQVTDRDAAEVQHVKTYAASHLAYNLIFATEYKHAEEILQQTLQKMGESGHPAVPTLLNSLGLKEERSKGDLNKALTCYFASLSKKRTVAKFQEPLLVTTLCNVAGQLSKTKRKHDFALRFLYEAEEIRRRAGWVHAYSALVVWNIGMVYMRKQMQVEALVKIKEAEHLYGAVNESHYANAEVKVWLAHCHLLLDNAQEAKQIFLEVLRNGEMYHKYRPQGEFVLNALEHLVHLSILDPKEQQSYIEEVLKELRRLNKCPGVCTISSRKYHQLLVKYAEILLKISYADDKSEPRSGIFLRCIPDTCLACQEVLNYVMCPTDIYLQKMNLLARSLAHRELQEQTENRIARRNLRTSTTGVCWTSKEPNNNFPLLKSEFSDESLNSNILPLPVKELSKSSSHLESVGSHQEVLNEFPDFNALFSLEENSVDCENNRVHPEGRGDISASGKNGTSETSGKNGTMKSMCQSYSSNLTGESARQFERNENILVNKQLWDLKSSTKIQQTVKNQGFYCRNLAESFKDNLDDTFNINVGTKFSGYSATLNGAGTNQTLQTFLRSRRTVEDPKTKQKYIIPSEQIANIDEQNRFQRSDSILSKLSFLAAKIDSASMTPMCYSSKNSDYLHPLNVQHLPNNSQRLIPNPVQEQQSPEPFWKNYGGSQYNFATKTEFKKPNEDKSFGPFKEKYSDLSKIPTFSTIPVEARLLNAYSSPKTGQNLCCANANFNINSPRSQSNILGLRLPMNDMSKNQFSQLTPKLISRREPVEHEERLN